MNFTGENGEFLSKKTDIMIHVFLLKAVVFRFMNPFKKYHMTII